MMRPYIGRWKRLAVHGVAAVCFGLAALVWPGITLYTLVLLALTIQAIQGDSRSTSGATCCDTCYHV